MKTVKRVGKFFRPFVDFPRWMGLTDIIAQGKWLGRLAKDLLPKNIPAKENVETFVAAAQRFKMTEADILRKQENFLKTAIIYTLFAIAVFAYTLYLFIVLKYFMAGLVGLAVTILALTFAFREHFWYFQMKQRRLGCSLREWSAFTFKRRK